MLQALLAGREVNTLAAVVSRLGICLMVLLAFASLRTGSSRSWMVRITDASLAARHDRGKII